MPSASHQPTARVYASPIPFANIASYGVCVASWFLVDSLTTQYGVSTVNMYGHNDSETYSMKRLTESWNITNSVSAFLGLATFACLRGRHRRIHERYRVDVSWTFTLKDCICMSSKFIHNWTWKRKKMVPFVVLLVIKHYPTSYHAVYTRYGSLSTNREQWNIYEYAHVSCE